MRYSLLLLIPFAASLCGCRTAPPLPQGAPTATVGTVVKIDSTPAVPRWLGSTESAKASAYATGGVVGGPLLYDLAKEMGRHYQYWIADLSGNEYKVAGDRELAVGACVKFTAVWAHSNQRIWEIGAAQVDKATGCHEPLR